MPQERRSYSKSFKPQVIAECAQADTSIANVALTHNLNANLVHKWNDGAVPIDNNWCENQIRPWALGRSNWWFAGSLRSGKRAAAIMSLIQSAWLNGHDPYAYLKDALIRLPTQRASEIAELLPHKWNPIEATISQASNF